MKKVKHHTVPECYLKNFTDKKGKNWMLDLASREIYPSNPNDVLTGNHFYTIKIPSGGGSLIVENSLAELEGSFIEVFRKRIENKDALSQQERANLAVFIGAMLFRTIQKRKMISKFVGNARQMIQSLRNMASKDKKWASTLKSLREDKSIPADVYLEITKDIGTFHSNMLMAILPELSSLVYQMRWCIFFSANTSFTFMTSDNPCALINPILVNKYGYGAINSSPGLSQDDVELVLPLSSNYCLVAGWKLDDETYIGADDNWIRKLNKRVMICAHEKLISSNKSQLEEACASMSD